MRASAGSGSSIPLLETPAAMVTAGGNPLSTVQLILCYVFCLARK